VFKSKDIESQLYDARLQQAALQIGEEKEKHLQDKQIVRYDEGFFSYRKFLLMISQCIPLKLNVTNLNVTTILNDLVCSHASEMHAQILGNIDAF